MRRRLDRRHRPAVKITMGRAARLRRFVALLAQRPRGRDEILREIGIGLRTFYRELVLVKKCGIKVLIRDRAYTIPAPAESAEGLLPFPDPQLSFAEMLELSRGPGRAAERLAGMLARVTHHPVAGAR
jgi:hypothetical protein